MNATELSFVIALFTVLLAVIARAEIRERRLQHIQSEVSYLRRDLDQLLKLYRLTPIKDQERRGR